MMLDCRTWLTMKSPFEIQWRVKHREKYLQWGTSRLLDNASNLSPSLLLFTFCQFVLFWLYIASCSTADKPRNTWRQLNINRKIEMIFSFLMARCIIDCRRGSRRAHLSGRSAENWYLWPEMTVRTASLQHCCVSFLPLSGNQSSEGWIASHPQRLHTATNEFWQICGFMLHSKVGTTMERGHELSLSDQSVQ